MQGVQQHHPCIKCDRTTYTVIRNDIVQCVMVQISSNFDAIKCTNITTYFTQQTIERYENIHNHNVVKF